MNGYLIELASKLGIKAPYNECIYNICKEKFENPEDFKPISVQEVWEHIEKNIS
ncbi:MAG: hypothetical protein GF329_13220 [Candidatus Lokiarchaeota archaeon]|nr:hypothetical protein [Candidatus Lokiarchaeota archaeon]